MATPYTITKVRTQAGNYPLAPNKREAALGRAVESYSDATAVKVAKFSFDYTDLTDGATVEIDASNAVEDSQIPANAIVGKVYMNVTTAFSGDGDGSSTISLGLASATDLQTATAISGAPYSSTGMKELLDGAAANMIILSSAAKLQAALVINSTDTALDDGEAVVYVEYVEGA